VKNVTDLAYITASVQSAQTEVWSLYRPPFNQLVHSALLECSRLSICETDAAATLVAKWGYFEHFLHVDLQNPVIRSLKMMNTMARVQTARFAIYELDAQ